MSPLQSRGDSEDAASEDSNFSSGGATPTAPKNVMPWKAAPACLDLEFSTAVESGEEGGVEVQIEIDSCDIPCF